MKGFEDAFRIVVAAEGGYVDNPNDPGGATRYGVTEAVARANGYLGPMQKFPLELAKRIYRESYWNAVRAEELPWPVSLYLFDMAVNSGPVQAIKTLQGSLGVLQDGILGPVSMGKALAMGAGQLALFLADRAVFYTELARFPVFGRGWLKRIFLLVQEANSKETV